MRGHYSPIIDSIHESLQFKLYCVKSKNKSRDSVTRIKTLYSSISSSMNLQTCEPWRRVYAFMARHIFHSQKYYFYLECGL